MMSQEKNRTITSIMVHAVLIIVSISMLLPFIWMLLTSFKTLTEATSVNPFVIFPENLRTEAYEAVSKNMDFVQLYINTLLMIFWRIVCAVLTATLAGYAFARLNFPGKNIAFSIVLLQMMIPVQIFLTPQYLMISKMGLTNTIFALVFPGLVSAFGTFLLRQGFMKLPKELEEASYIDGCSIPQTFYYVMLPLTKSSMVALGIFTAVIAYKDLLWPMIVNIDKDKLVLSSALAKLQGQYVAKFPELMAASLIACIPMIILYIIFQKQFVEGIATSGGKL